ncbi:MAG: hypothetical protein UV28_C0023G0001, partial [Candidatus Collierbacteria bacterium GW2011_GWE2_42_48]
MKKGLFYSLAKKVETSEKQFSFSRSCLTVRNSEVYAHWIGTYSNLSVLEINLDGEKEKN